MHRTALALVVAVSSTLAACSGATSSDATPVLASPATVVDGTRAPLTHTASGRAKRVLDALAQVSLRNDQRAQIEAMAAETEARHGAVLAARQAVAGMIATQIEAGAIDRAALAPKVDAMLGALRDLQAKDRAAFEALHGLLEPAQRAELADVMEAGGHGGHHAHEGHDWKDHDHGGHWADELGLSDEQRAAFKQIVREAFSDKDGPEHGFGHGMRHGKETLEAFRGETFSMDAVSPPEDIGAHASRHLGHVLDIADKVLPMLTPEQRALAAQKVRERSELVGAPD
jgi:Spy/CpxP family protein refolding chaperone